MADNVQFILDRMSSTLRQVEALKLFTTVSSTRFYYDDDVFHQKQKNILYFDMSSLL